MSSDPPSEPARAAPPEMSTGAELQPLAARWVFRTNGAIAAGLAVVGALVVTTLPVATLVAVVFGGVNVGVALRGSRNARGRQLLGAAADAIELGRFDAAERLIDLAARRFSAASVVRAASVARASLRLHQGDLAGADQSASEVLGAEAIGAEHGSRMGGQAWITRVEALGIRAMARAATGDGEGARQDAQALRGMIATGALRGPAFLGTGRAIEESLARAALAEAIELAQRGDRNALRVHLTAHERTLRASTRPRERALLRGFDRMLASDRDSPYRQKRSTADGPLAIDDWVATMLPDVAPYVASPRDRGAAAALPRVAFTALSTPARDWSSPRRIAGLVAAWVVVDAIAFGLNFADIPVAARNGVLVMTMAVPLLMLLAITLFAAIRGVRLASHARSLAHAVGQWAASGEAPRLEELTDATEPVLAAQAMLLLARQRNLAGEFAEASELAERGLLRTRPYLRRAEAEQEIRPALLAELALAHAALGQVDLALSEVESIPEGFAYRARSRFTVRLVALARSGDRQGATALAQQRAADLALDEPVESLADVLRATAARSTMGLAERARVTSDLERSASLRAWVEAIVPGALEDLDLAPVSHSRVRIGTGEGESARAPKQKAQLVSLASTAGGARAPDGSTVERDPAVAEEAEAEAEVDSGMALRAAVRRVAK